MKLEELSGVGDDLLLPLTPGNARRNSGNDRPGEGNDRPGEGGWLRQVLPRVMGWSAPTWPCWEVRAQRSLFPFQLEPSYPLTPVPFIQG